LADLLMVAEIRDNLTARRSLGDQGAVAYQVANNDLRKEVAMSGRARVIAFFGQISRKLVSDRHSF
jgi:hypothetical protein